jgi:hypothetical protein
MNSRISRVRNGDSELSALLIKLKELTFGRYNGILQTHNFHHQRFKIGTTDLFWLEGDALNTSANDHNKDNEDSNNIRHDVKK